MSQHSMAKGWKIKKSRALRTDIRQIEKDLIEILLMNIIS